MLSAAFRQHGRSLGALLGCQLRVANGKLADKEKELAKVGADLGECQARLDDAKWTKRDLQDDTDCCKKRMDAANGLIEALSGERDRWTMQRNQ